MDYKDLADAIYPDAKDIKYYEDMYPARDLPEGAEVVRIGPSPTGFVHVGTIFQALLNQTIARQSNGVFFVRIEDTDQNRKIENGVTDIINSLKNNPNNKPTYTLAKNSILETIKEKPASKVASKKKGGK